LGKSQENSGDLLKNNIREKSVSTVTSIGNPQVTYLNAF